MNGKNRIKEIYSLAKQIDGLLFSLTTKIPDDWDSRGQSEKEKLFIQFLEKHNLYMENVLSLSYAVQDLLDTFEVFDFLEEELVGGWSIGDIRDFFPYMSPKNVSDLFVYFKSVHGDSSKRLSFKSFSKIMWEGVEQIYKKQENEL